MRVRMMMVAVGALVTAACSESNTLTGPEALFEIVDGLDASGNQSFYWLPPILLGPSPSGGANLTGLEPDVKIFECVGGDCSSLGADPVAAFTTLTGPGSETVRDGGDHYIVNWHTDRGPSDGVLAGGTYRICVSADDINLGHADVLVGNNGKDVKNARSNNKVPLVDGATLPIKFRIEDAYLTGGSDDGCPVGASPTLATLKGMVTIDGDPAGGGIWITLFDAWNNQVGGPVEPSEGGSYSFVDLTTGEYTVCATNLGGFLALPDATANTCPNGSAGYRLLDLPAGVTVQDFAFLAP